jgi:WD40 repeat protein
VKGSSQDYRCLVIIKDFLGFNSRLLSASFCNKRYIVAGRDDGTIKIWDLDRNCEDHKIEAHLGYVRPIIITKDSKTCISSGYDQKIVVCDIGTRLIISKVHLADFEIPINITLFHFQNLLAVSSSQQIYIYSMPTLELIQKTTINLIRSPKHIGVTNNGKYIVASDSNNLFYVIKTGLNL